MRGKIMIETLWGITAECWALLEESAPYVLFGFIAAGLLKALIPEEFVAKHLGENNSKSVLKASLIGIPLPLCSCGVIPAAIGLRKQGAAKGPSAAFLVSTPESGVDSIAITYALLDPIMTVVRPVSAFISATVAGLLINRCPEEEPFSNQETKDSCGCKGSACQSAEPSPEEPILKRLRSGISYAFGELLSDIGRWLLVGIGIAGIISYFVPEDFFGKYLGGEISSLFIMLIVGVPLYICASASTPVAAALVLKGLSPGAALVFLLAGPATNAATLTVISKFWGRRSAGVYLAAISLCSLVLGWLLNRLYSFTGSDISQWVESGAHESGSTFELISAILLLALIGRHFLPKKNADGGCCGSN